MRLARWNEDVQGRLLLLGEIAVLRMQRNENGPSNDKRRDAGPSGISCPLFNLQEPLVNVPIRRRSSCFSGPLPGAMRKAPISMLATSPPDERLGSCLRIPDRYRHRRQATTGPHWDAAVNSLVRIAMQNFLHLHPKSSQGARRWRRNEAARNGVRPRDAGNGPSCVSPARQLKREESLRNSAVWFCGLSCHQRTTRPPGLWLSR